MYHARDALQQAARDQAQSDPARQDLPAYGSALLSTLSALGELAAVLADQIDQVDRDRVRREALRDHPEAAVDQAIGHLNALRHVLSTAVTDAENYWSSTQHLWANTHQPSEDQE